MSRDPKKLEVTVIIPVHNSATTLKTVFDSLERQKYKISQIVVLDNNSDDQSFKIMTEFSKSSSSPVTIIRHSTDRGLSFSYNEALAKAKTEFVITLQSDCVIRDSDGIDKLLEPFVEDPKILASCSRQITPYEIWKKYNFWQKALFSRHVGRVASGRNGRFCCYRLSALSEIGFFDSKSYRTAGEDGDVFFKLMEKGRVVDVDTVVDHLHSISPRFSVQDYVYKENQLAEGAGACFRNNLSRTSIFNYKTPLLRIILVLSLVIPWVNMVSLGSILVYCLFLTKEVYLQEIRNYRILLLFVVNAYLLFGYSYYFIKGFITGREQL